MKNLLLLSLMVPSAIFGGEKDDQNLSLQQSKKNNKKVTFSDTVKIREFTVQEDLEEVQEIYKKFAKELLEEILTAAVIAGEENKNKKVADKQSRERILNSLKNKYDILLRKKAVQSFCGENDYPLESGLANIVNTIEENIKTLCVEYLQHGGKESDVLVFKKPITELEQKYYAYGNEGKILVTEKKPNNNNIEKNSSVTQGGGEQIVVPKWKPFLFKTAGVTTLVGLTGLLTYRNKDRIVAGADRLTNGAFSQYAAAAWDKVPVMPKFTFARPQFSGFGSGINLGFFGNKAQSAFVGARSYVSNLFSNLKR